MGWSLQAPEVPVAKNSVPMMQSSGGGALGKVVRTLVLIALVVLIIKFPADAAAFAKSAADVAGEVIGGLVTFLRSLG